MSIFTNLNSKTKVIPIKILGNLFVGMSCNLKIYLGD